MSEFSQELLNQVHEINQNLAIFIDLFRYRGVYDSYEIDISANNQKSKVLFSFPARKIIIRAHQPIKICLNDKRQPDITIQNDEFPFTLKLSPGMLVDRLFITTGDNNTHVRILIFG